MSANTEHKKIKTCFAQIIVEEIAGKPHYSIMYWENGEMNIGFSSYKLDYVRRWLNEEFEVKRNVDVAPVVRCKDCKHFNHEHMECENEAVSTDHEGGAQYSLNFWLDDFCSYGERMDGGADNAAD